MKSNRSESLQFGKAGSVGLASRHRSTRVPEGVRTPPDWDGVVCPVCHGALRRTARRGPAGTHLIHRAMADDHRCPLTTHAWQPDGLMVRQRRDPRTTKAHYTTFLANWVQHYAAAKRLAPTLSVQRFARVIEYANVLNLWSHPQLRHEELPYVLLALAGFIRQPGADGGSTWVHFFFDRSVRDVSDLWMAERPADSLFFRMIYDEPAFTPFPTGAELICWELLDRDESLTPADFPHVNGLDVRAFESFIADSRRAGE